MSTKHIRIIAKVPPATQPAIGPPQAEVTARLDYHADDESVSTVLVSYAGPLDGYAQSFLAASLAVLDPAYSEPSPPSDANGT